MAGSDAAGSLESTPTWTVAIVCSVLIILSLSIEHAIHLLSLVFTKKKREALNQALNQIQTGEEAKMKNWKKWEEETRSVEYKLSNDPRKLKLANRTSIRHRHLNFWSNYRSLLWLSFLVSGYSFDAVAAAGSSSSAQLVPSSPVVRALPNIPISVDDQMIAATPGTVEVYGDLIASHTSAFYKTLETLIGRALNGKCTIEYIQRMCKYPIDAIRDCGDQSRAEAFQQILSELRHLIHDYHEFIRGNMESHVNAECEAMEQEYAACQAAFENTIAAYTIQSGDVEAIIMDINSTLATCQAEEEADVRKITEAEAEITRLQAIIQETQQHQAGIIEQRQKAWDELASRNRQQDLILAKRNAEITRHTQAMESLAPANRRNVARERVLATKEDRAASLRQKVLNLSVRPQE